SETGSAQRELDHKLFLLKTLHDAARDFLAMGEPREMLSTFLLMSMGSMGTGKGFVLLLDPGTTDVLVEHRGLDAQESAGLLSESAHIATTYIRDCGLSVLDEGRSHARLVLRGGDGSPASLPPGTDVVLVWALDEGCSGLCGLGRKITGQPYTDGDVDYLLNLVDLMAQALAKTLAIRTAQGLNREMERKHAELERLLNRTESSQVELDKRVYHLNVLYDTTVELSRFSRPREIIDSFLLLLLGSFSVENGLILLPGKQGQELEISLRGDFSESSGRVADGPDTVADPVSLLGLDLTHAKQLLYLCMGAVDFEKLTPLSAQLLPGASDSLWDQAPELPVRPHAAILFRIGEGSPGLLCLGPRLTGDPYKDEDLEVLLTLCGNFLIFMKNARAFATIEGLNTDLSARNIELQTTLDELTASRSRVEFLERAGARVSAALKREMDRLGRASKWDLLWVALAALVLGLAFNSFSPFGVPLVPEVMTRESSPSLDAAQALDLYESGQALIIDARPPEFFAQGHVAEAVNLPPALFDFIYAMKIAPLDPSTPLLVHGRSISSIYDEEVAHRLSSQGHGQVMVIHSDLEELEELGFPVERPRETPAS
ncbi:MAG: rhodanese-like domain-containing protein, partial [Desulfovibrio sp.]